MLRERLEAANELADLIAGGVRKEFGREPGHNNLRRFLDVDFRGDLKNLAMYSWSGAIWTTYKPEAGEEFIVRCGQFLVERRYLKRKDAPDLIQIIQGKGDVRLQLLIQRLAGGQKSWAGQNPGPCQNQLRSLLTLEAFRTSRDEYLAGADIYRTKLRQ